MATQKVMKMKEDAHRKKLEDGIMEILDGQNELLTTMDDLMERLDAMLKKPAPKKSGGQRAKAK